METKIINVVKVKQDITNDKFLSYVLTRLAHEQHVPEDIFDGTFKVENEEMDFLLTQADVSVTFSGTVGFDRKETKKEYNSSTGKYETKTYTVTDWQPFSGANTSKETVFVCNKNSEPTPKWFNSPYSLAQEGSWGEWLAFKISKLPKQKIDGLCEYLNEDDNYEYTSRDLDVNSNALQKAKQVCIDECFYSVKLPGDHQKGFNHSGLADITSIEKFYAPVQKLKFTYKGSSYCIADFAFGNKKPSNSKDALINDMAGDIYPTDNVGEEMAKKARAPWLVSGIIGTIGSVLSFILGNSSLGIWLAVASIILYIISGAVFSSKKKNFYAERLQRKLEKLNAYLKKHNIKG